MMERGRATCFRCGARVDVSIKGEKHKVCPHDQPSDRPKWVRFPTACVPGYNARRWVYDEDLFMGPLHVRSSQPRRVMDVDKLSDLDLQALFEQVEFEMVRRAERN